jgi:acyl-homoserine lactone acylase PvdQ
MVVEHNGGTGDLHGRDHLLESALAAAGATLSQTLGTDMSRWTWGQIHTATFQHALASTGDAARLRFNVGPFLRGGYGDTVFATGGSDTRQTVGVTSREVMDLADWDRSIGTSAPGQSGQPGSPTSTTSRSCGRQSSISRTRSPRRSSRRTPKRRSCCGLVADTRATGDGR